MEIVPPTVERSSRMRRMDAILILAGLLVATGLFIYIGMGDISEALTYFGRLAGGFFLGASLITLIAMIAMWNYKWGNRQLEYSAIAVTLGVLVVWITSLILLIVGVQGKEYSRALVLAALSFLFLGSNWALWRLYRQNVLRDASYPKRFALGAAIAGFVGIANMSYSQMYEPSVSPVNMGLTAKFGTPRAHPDGTRVYLPLNLSLQNKSKTGLYLLGSIFYVYRVDGRYTTTPRKEKDLQAEFEQGRNTQDRFMNVKKYELVSRGNFIQPLQPDPVTQEAKVDSLNPGETREFQHIVILPRKDEYDVIEAWAQITVMRMDRATPKTVGVYPSQDKKSLPKWVTKNGRDNRKHVKASIDLDPSTLIFKLTRNERQVIVYLPIVSEMTYEPYFPELKYTIVAKGDEPRSRPNLVDLASRYGIINVSSGTSAISLLATTVPTR